MEDPVEQEKLPDHDGVRLTIRTRNPRRTSEAANTIGAHALLIHAESDTARAFYQQLAEFEPSPTDVPHLFLLMKDLRATIQRREDSTS